MDGVDIESRLGQENSMQPTTDMKQTVEHLSDQVANLRFSEELFAELFVAFGAELDFGILKIEHMSNDNMKTIFPMLKRHLMKKLGKGDETRGL